MKKLSFVVLIALFAAVNMQARESLTEETKEEKSTNEFTKFRIGGYGEVLYQGFDYHPNRFSGAGVGSKKLDDYRHQVSIPRYILAMDAKFGKGWSFGGEIEFEYGGTGVAIEPEYGEGIEYEYEFEKAGEVVLEQMWIEKSFGQYLQVRAGHMIVPVGITNFQHEPIFYLGTTRPEGESTIIPCTWHETGISIIGRYKWLGYQAMLVNGLDPLGFGDTNWIQNGRQRLYETTSFQNPAFAARLNFFATKGLRLGLSGYYSAKTSGNVVDVAETDHFDAPVALGSADAEYRNHGLIVRANVLYGYVGDVDEINAIRRDAFSGYENKKVSQNALTYFVEAGYNVGKYIKKDLNITPFVRYEYLDSEQNDSFSADPRNNARVFAAGLNYFPIPGLVVKADYTHRMIGENGMSFNNENTFSLAVGFTSWFFQK